MDSKYEYSFGGQNKAVSRAGFTCELDKLNFGRHSKHGVRRAAATLKVK